MKNKNLLLLTFLLFSMTLLAQTNKKNWKVEFSGFVKTDMFFDTRQTVSVREQHFLLYPKAEQFDVMGKDINDKANFNILSIQTRLRAKVTGPVIAGAKSSAFVEGAFFGHTNADINGFRLRHAFLKLDWKNTALLIGQYWHPFFVPEVFPGVVSFNTGVPFQPFSRNPQIRLTQKFNKLFLTLTAASQRDFADIGPAGTGSVYLRNSGIPMLGAQLMYKSKGVVIGGGLNIKTLLPRLVTTKNYKSEETITATAFIGYLKFVHKNFSAKFEGVYGSDMYDLLMIGGYGVKSTDPITGIEKYEGIKTFSMWTDLSYGKKIAVGLFAGYSKNMGADVNINGPIFARGSNIEYAFRITPRLIYNLNKVRFATELEYTTASYGTISSDATVANSKSISNLRLLIAAYYFF